MMSHFDNEQLAGFIFDVATESEATAIGRAALVDRELCAKIAAMQMVCGLPVLGAYAPGDTDARLRTTPAPSSLLSQVGTEIDAILRRHSQRGVPLYTLRIRDVVDECYQAILAGSDPSPELRTAFYRTSARCIADALTSHARKLMAERDGARTSVGELETRVATSEATSFALSERQPERVLARWDRYEEFNEFAPEDAEIYFLSTFAGRSLEEIAALRSEDVEEIAERLAAASTEVQLDDEGGQTDATDR